MAMAVGSNFAGGITEAGRFVRWNEHQEPIARGRYTRVSSDDAATCFVRRDGHVECEGHRASVP